MINRKWNLRRSGFHFMFNAKFNFIYSTLGVNAVAQMFKTAVCVKYIYYRLQQYLLRKLLHWE